MNRQKVASADDFLRKAFAQNVPAKNIFAELVELGCDRSMLREWMFAISTTLTMLRSHGAGSRRHLAKWDFMVLLSEVELKKLCDRLLWVAVKIEQLSQFEISKYMKLMPLLAGQDSKARKRINFLQAQRFSDLPAMLRLYEKSLREAYEYLAKSYKPKKYDVVVAMEAEWLDNVKESTGKFHFEKIGSLLEAGCEALMGSNPEICNRFAGDAVRKRYRLFRKRHHRIGYRIPSRVIRSPEQKRTHPA